MSDSIVKLEGVSKWSQYESLLVQLESLLGGEKDTIANMANAAAAIKEVFGFFWVGFYIVRDNQLVLGPFQGPIACTRIAFGRGVCGTAWKEARTLIVPDVEVFPGHIACSSLSKSEIVIPLVQEQKIWAVLDVDSDQVDKFDGVDSEFLEKIGALIQN
jgi:GAF domain-containing protein